MTNERFTLDFEDNGVLVIDEWENGKCIITHEWDVNVIVSKFNKLYEENEQLKSYIKTLGIGISKILQSIKDDKEEKAMIMCLEILKKLEEEELEE